MGQSLKSKITAAQEKLQPGKSDEYSPETREAGRSQLKLCLTRLKSKSRKKWILLAASPNTMIVVKHVAPAHNHCFQIAGITYNFSANHRLFCYLSTQYAGSAESGLKRVQ